MQLLLQVGFISCQCNLSNSAHGIFPLVTIESLHTGVLGDPDAPSSFGAWLKHACSHHTGAMSFLIAEFFLFSGVAALTALQAYQVTPIVPYCTSLCSNEKQQHFFSFLFIVVTQLHVTLLLLI